MYHFWIAMIVIFAILQSGSLKDIDGDRSNGESLNTEIDIRLVDF